MDFTLVGLDNKHCFLNDINVVIRGSIEGQLKLAYKCLKKQDADNWSKNLPKCHFTKTEIDWVYGREGGYPQRAQGSPH